MSRLREAFELTRGLFFSQNSLVFVSQTHGVWARKPSKRYGTLRQSPKTHLSEMLADHKEEVFQWLAERADQEDDEATEDEEDVDQDLPMKG